MLWRIIGPMAMLFNCFFVTTSEAVDPEGPKAVFAIDDGFISVAVTRDGKIPVFAKLQVLLPNGAKWAEGETDEQGKCTIPQPDTKSCDVGFVIDGTPSPAITLTFLDGGKTVVPLVAPLVPGECCKVVRPVFPPEAEEPPVTSPVKPWHFFLGVSAVVVVFVSVRFWRARSDRS